MKQLLRLSLLPLLCILSFQQQSWASIVTKASISGPEGRCAVAPGVATTYTGSHNFSSSRHSIYEWTIVGGTITGPSGTSISNGTLCIAENGLGFAKLSFDCNVADIDINVANGNGATVTVVWDQGVSGTLSLKAREVGSKTLQAFDHLIVDNSKVCSDDYTISENTNVNSADYRKTPTDSKGDITDRITSPVLNAQLSTEKMTIYPTLVNQQQDLQVRLPNLEASATLTIIDLNGKIVLQQKAIDQQVQVSTQDLNPGMYILLGQSKQWRSSQKFVVK